MLKKIIITVIVLVFGLQLNAQEKYTDEEIGFDEKSYVEGYLEEGLNRKEIEQFVIEIRAKYLEYFLNKKDLVSSVNTNIDGCLNLGIEQGNFDGWCHMEGLFIEYNPTDGYDINYSGNLICSPGNIPSDSSTCNDENRLEIVTQTDIENDILFADFTSVIEGDFAMKLGNSCNNGRLDRIQNTFTVTSSNTVIDYNYAIALQDAGGVCGHINYEGIPPSSCDVNNPPPVGTVITKHEKPFFRVFLEDADGDKIECSEFLIFADDRIFSFDKKMDIPGVPGGDFLIRDWRQNSINLLDYVNLNDEVTIVAEVADCGQTLHSGYAYFEASCGTANINEVEITAAPTPKCINETITFSPSEIVEDFIWTFYDLDGETVLDVSMDTSPTFTYSEPGFYIVTYGLPNTGTTANCPENNPSILVEIEDCASSNDACNDCYSFKPKPDTQYVISAWVKEETPGQVKTYENSSIKIKYLNGDEVTVSEQLFWPKGRIIEGWQRIYKEFTIPENTVTVELVLQNRNTVPTYFDDIRIHPFNGNMKSFVYDPITQRLMAELDENNYSTFYEYDSEGGLIRVKKETQKGVYTIQETRSKSSIKD